jgi:hypothetical protein
MWAVADAEASTNAQKYPSAQTNAQISIGTE